jgi:hypothetical protein
MSESPLLLQRVAKPERSPALSFQEGFERSLNSLMLPAVKDAKIGDLH